MNPLRCLALTICVLGMLPAHTSAQTGALTFQRLTCMSWAELEAVYRAAAPGDVPVGFVRGWTTYHPCTPLAHIRTKAANRLWKGKHFFPEDSTLINQWPGFRAIRADVYAGDSWLDGRPAHVLDYADKSFVWRDVRDELRQVGPGLYVGAMYLRDCPTPRLKTLFVLEAVGCCDRR
jgi:hypothetical protein